MIRCLHLIGSKQSGGAERFYCRLVNALHETTGTILAALPPQSTLREALNAQVPQKPISMRNVWDPWARWQIRRLIRDYQPDIIQTYMGRATRLTRIPGNVGPIHIARLGDYYNLKGYRHAHAWVGNTRGICQYLVQQGMPAARVFHISNFVDLPLPAKLALLHQLKAELTIPEDAWVLLAVGRLHPVKGFEDLLAAFALLPKSIAGRPVHLLIAGDGPLRQKLQIEAANLRLEGRVHWGGWQQNPSVFYQLADIFICPSRHEPLGNVILEAWSHGKPVIATNTQGAQELMTPTENGWITPNADPKALSKAISALLTDETLQAQLGKNGFATLQRHHSQEAIVTAYLNLYSQLLGH
ncbi:glycosyltransferase [Nitrosococcus watsonii]|uniref:Glycosyl transferase group 1 n=1 Tax=Nitrosococcus watsoni (strain C-113) TaxID=105559 RepID=D8K9U5_NITWC|nr:glycosyltransferase [Nitrosococcus watsonii]ADJ29303.1 glycosyl transferase group 1 [Nitrosococcus watsonii C-113]